MSEPDVRYRVGGSWGVTVVVEEGGKPDRLMGTMQSLEYAQLVVDALNGSLAAEVVRLRAEVALGREVIWQARRWRDQFARPTTSTGPRHVALCEAVDAYEADQPVTSEE